MANKGTIYGLSAKEYNPVLEELLVSWIKAQCDVDWPRPGKTAFQNWLKDGYVLGILIISLYGVMKPIDRPIKTSIIFQQKNQIGQFLQAAENYGLPKTDLFRIYDLWEGKDLAAVQRTLMALHSLANNRR